MLLLNPTKKQFKVFQVSDKKKKLFLNDKYIITPQNKYFEFVEFYVSLLNEKNKINSFNEELGINLYSFLELSLFRQKQRLEKPRNSTFDDICKICLQPFGHKEIDQQVQADSDLDLYSLSCDHILHKRCILDHMSTNNFLKCPKCLKMIGLIFGNMPDGIMTHKINEQLACEGYKKGTIVVEYEMFGGEKDGQIYDGAHFIAYIPMNGLGHQVLFLLQEAFRRKLTFTITKNKSKVHEISWGKISHKTCTYGGIKNNGFPDEKYFDKVLNDLKMHGLQMI